MSYSHNVTRRALVAGAVASGLAATPEVDRAGANRDTRKQSKRRKNSRNSRQGRGATLGPVAAEVYVGAYFTGLRATLAGDVYVASIDASFIHPGNGWQGDLGDVTSTVPAGSSLEVIRANAVDAVKAAVIEFLFSIHGHNVPPANVTVTLM